MNAALQPTCARLMWGRSAYPHPGKWLGTGNRCGHDPLKGEFHRYSTPETRRSLPKVQEKLLEGVHEYYRNPEILPTLSNLSGKANSDGSPRSNRSEARAADCLVLSAILQHTEYATLRVGTPQPDGSFVPRSCGELAKVAGLLEKGCDPERPEPSKRFWRAFERLRLAGAIKVHRQYEVLEDGSKRARPAIKNLSFQFLVCLGKVGFAQLKKFRDHCSNRLKKVRRQYRERFPAKGDAAQARRNLVVGQAGEGIDIKSLLPPVKRGPRDLPMANQDKQAIKNDSLDQLAFIAEVKRANPGATDAQVLELMRKKYPPRSQRE